MNQQELANKIGVSKMTIINLEKSRYKTKVSSPQVTEKLCKVFNVSPFMLYGLDNLIYFPETKKELDWLIDELVREKEQWDLEKILKK